MAQVSWATIYTDSWSFPDESGVQIGVFTLLPVSLKLSRLWLYLVLFHLQTAAWLYLTNPQLWKLVVLGSAPWEDTKVWTDLQWENGLCQLAAGRIPLHSTRCVNARYPCKFSFPWPSGTAGGGGTASNPAGSSSLSRCVNGNTQAPRRVTAAASLFLSPLTRAGATRGSRERPLAVPSRCARRSSAPEPPQFAASRGLCRSAGRHQATTPSPSCSALPRPASPGPRCLYPPRGWGRGRGRGRRTLWGRAGSSREQACGARGGH